MALALALALPACKVTVNTEHDTVDARPGDGRCADSEGFCSLRAAVQEAQSGSGMTTIVLSNKRYVLTRGEPLKVRTSSLTIQGTGAGRTFVDADRAHSAFEVSGGANLRLTQATIRNGRSQAGAGIAVLGGALELHEVQFDDNRARSGGGALYVERGARATGTKVELLGNRSAGAKGGAVWNRGELTLADSVVHRNEGAAVGGISNDVGARLVLRNVLVSENRVGRRGALPADHHVGALLQEGVATLSNATLARNLIELPAGPASAGGLVTTASGRTSMYNSIVADNATRVDATESPSDCVGRLGGGSRYNLVRDVARCRLGAYAGTFVVGQDPLLEPVEGSLTRLGALVPADGSPAIDAGSFDAPGSDAPAACTAHDQHGVPRPQRPGSDAGGGRCDLGAHEVGGFDARAYLFALVDADTGTRVRQLRTGDLLLADDLPERYTIEVRHTGRTPGSVAFTVDGIDANVDSSRPYRLSTGTGGAPSPYPLRNGYHRIRATPHSGAGADGSAGASGTVTFFVYDADA